MFGDGCEEIFRIDKEDFILVGIHDPAKLFGKGEYKIGVKISSELANPNGVETYFPVTRTDLLAIEESIHKRFSYQVPAVA